MAQISVRYLTSRPGRAGELPRWFWQPGPRQRAEGWRSERVPLDWASYRDEAALEAAAIARARELNEHMDAVRAAAAIAASRPASPAGPRTLGQLIAAYRASAHFERLQPSTQRGYRQCLAKIEAWGADAPVRAIDAPRIQRLREAFAATPAYANAVVRVMRLLMDYGRLEGWLTVNPAAKPGLIGAEPTGLIWPRAAVEDFIDVADELGCFSMGTAVRLNEWMGQRQGDVIRMPRSVLRGGDLVIRQHKTGAGLKLPVSMVGPLRDRLADELARHAAREAKPGAFPAMTIIVSEETGRAYLADNFRHVFARVRAKLAERTPSYEVEHLMPGRDMTDPDAFTVKTTDLTFMALRHTAVTRLAEAGCDTGLISSITGHAQATVHSLMERYMVKTASMARAAFQKRLDAEAPPAAVVENEGTAS